MIIIVRIIENPNNKIFGRGAFLVMLYKPLKLCIFSLIYYGLVRVDQNIYGKYTNLQLKSFKNR